jgi:hypothetical protein
VATQMPAGGVHEGAGYRVVPAAVVPAARNTQTIRQPNPGSLTIGVPFPTGRARRLDAVGSGATSRSSDRRWSVSPLRRALSWRWPSGPADLTKAVATIEGQSRYVRTNAGFQVQDAKGVLS